MWKIFLLILRINCGQYIINFLLLVESSSQTLAQDEKDSLSKKTEGKSINYIALQL